MQTRTKFVLAYVAILSLAALPFCWTAPIRRPAQVVLAHFGIVPGLPLFAHKGKKEWKARSSCVVVKTTSADGSELQKIYETRKLCYRGPLRLFAPMHEIAVLRLAQDSKLDEPRHSQAMRAALGDFFCYSKQASPIDRSKSMIAVGVEERFIHYQSGRKSERVSFLMRWDCKTNQEIDAFHLPNIPRATIVAFKQNRSWPIP